MNTHNVSAVADEDGDLEHEEEDPLDDEDWEATQELPSVEIVCKCLQRVLINRPKALTGSTGNTVEC